MEPYSYIDVETVGVLRERGLSDALMDSENHLIEVVTHHFIDDDEEIEYERFTMLDWWAPQDIADAVADANRRFVEQGICDSVRVTVGSSKNANIQYTNAWRSA